MSATSQPNFAAASEIPPLVQGDRLTSAEFRRRWEAMPHIKNAELIDGVVYMQASVRHRQHGAPHGDIVGWLWAYRSLTPGIGLGDNSTLGLPDDNDPQPDAFLILPAEMGGNTLESASGYLEGSPDLVAEVSAASERLDLGPKMRLYERSGVQEYLVWRTEAKVIDWFSLESGRYVPLAADQGVLKSIRFPGLWMDVAAMIAGDAQRVLEVLQQGVATAEHAAFKAELAKLKAGKK